MATFEAHLARDAAAAAGGEGLLRLVGLRPRRTRCASLRRGCTRRGLIRSSPQKLYTAHTDQRFLDELKRELKA